jgi:hypothetical protein
MCEHIIKNITVKEKGQEIFWFAYSPDENGFRYKANSSMHFFACK